MYSYEQDAKSLQKQGAIDVAREKFASELSKLAIGLKDFLQVDLTIRLFGRVIWEWHFPPKSE